VFALAAGWGGFLARLLLACGGLGAALMLLAPGAEVWLEAELMLRIAWLLGLVVGGVLLYFTILALTGYGPRRLLALTAPAEPEAAADRV
jgi:peptidoglycan biosynthesis protein MviN/MurJ (putative lipid II flippase)